ncbi:carbohydrate kinase family protein [Roseobacteraceae bacterium NS-SX3]
MIYCCGEALIDMIPGQTAAGEAAFVPRCGGAAFNTTLALARLGAPAGLLAALPADRFGRMLREALRQAGADTSLCAVSTQPPALAFVHLEDGQPSYEFCGADGIAAGFAPSSPPELPGKARVLLFGGISLCNGPVAEAYLALARREAGRRILMLDPNVRPGFARDETVYRTRLSQMTALARIVKVSDEDLDWLEPGAAPMADKVQRILDAGPGLVILTRGRKGAAAWLRGGTSVTVPAVPVRASDTVGAGDAFNAGFLARALELNVLTEAAEGSLPADALRACLDFGARAAAVSLSRPGANPPWRHELEP